MKSINDTAAQKIAWDIMDMIDMQLVNMHKSHPDFALPFALGYSSALYDLHVEISKRYKLLNKHKEKKS